MVNITVLNGLGAAGRIVGAPVWVEARNGHLITVESNHSGALWPWSGWLAIAIRVRYTISGKDAACALCAAAAFAATPLPLPCNSAGSRLPFMSGGDTFACLKSAPWPCVVCF